MCTILEKIVARKKEEVALRQLSVPHSSLEKNIAFDRPVFSLKKSLTDPQKCGIIAEFKRKSPSKGDINVAAEVGQTTTGYIQSGASALSILTDESFFGGSMEDFKTARRLNNCPILRKDFIISEYQVTEAWSIGADVILLIAAILTPALALALAKLAKEMEMEVLLEIHNKEELNRLNQHIDIVGVNNRNLNDFSVSINRSIELFDLIPSEFIKISESGIDSPEALLTLKDKGYQGFLMAEKFMATDRPEIACADFIRKVKILELNKCTIKSL